MIEATEVSSILDRCLKNLHLDKTALMKAENVPEQLKENAALIADTEAARNLIVLGASARRDLIDRARRHRQILPLCAAAKEEFEKLSRTIEPTNYAYLVADSAHQTARDALAKHRENPIPVSSYPSAKQTREWNMELHRLEKRAEEKRLELLAKSAERGNVQNRYNAAKTEFERLAFQERQLRPPAAPAKIIATAWRAPEQAEVTPLGPNR